MAIAGGVRETKPRSRLEKQKTERSSTQSKGKAKLHLKPLPTQIAQVGVEDDTEDGSSVDEDLLSPMLTKDIKSLQGGPGTPAVHVKQPLITPTRNAFSPIGNDDDADNEKNSEPVISQMNGRAHTVKVTSISKTKATIVPRLHLLRWITTHTHSEEIERSRPAARRDDPERHDTLQAVRRAS